MKKHIFYHLLLLVFAAFAVSTVAQEPPESEFDEDAIRHLQEGASPSNQFQQLVQAFETQTNPEDKAGVWKALIVDAGDGILSQTWTEPAGGWKLLEFPAQGDISVQQVVTQAWEKVSKTKLVAQNDADAVRLRGAGALLQLVSADGEEWGEAFLLDIAQSPDGNLKRLTYWFTRNFGQDVNAIVWSPDWVAWQQAYTSANALGKAIILRNLTMLAVKTNEPSVACNIYVSALSGSDRELKAIALVFSHPALGSAVIQKWNEIANNGSDPQLQVLANEMKNTFGVE